jgi:hypothetical protein
LEATAIFPNQDMKCQVAKLRAVAWARGVGKEISWVAAQDKATHPEHQKRPYVHEDKERWLKYHDKSCADMPGWLPLAKGLPVVLSDHLDRSTKQLLRGKEATIDHWVEDDEETNARTNDAERTLTRMPRMIVLDFHCSEWRLQCMSRPGLYPVFPTARTWTLDAYRPRPMLSVKRRQFLITPGLASTAHAAQGRTMPAVIADLREGRNVSWMASYVAITRVRYREDLLIYRPFDRTPFTKGEMMGTKLLLSKLRGETIKWNDIEESIMPRKK